MVKTFQKAVFILILPLFIGCDNEIDIAADWQEIPIIYGLIDCNSDEHYVRVQRAYLDEKESALKFTNIADSLYFDSLSVEIVEYTNNRESGKWLLERINGNELGIEKDSGMFSNDPNYLYYLKQQFKLSPLTFNINYRIFVRNLKSNKYWTADLTAPGATTMFLPVSESLNQLFFDSSSNNNIVFRFKEGKNTAAYSGEIIFHITEMQANDTSMKVSKTLNWRVFESVKTVGNAFNGESRITRPTVSMMRFLNANLIEDPNILRRIDAVDVLVYGLDDEFQTFLNVNRPSLSIVQKKPEYTNIERGGFGIWSSRTVTQINGSAISERGMAALQVNILTRNLNFIP